LRPRRRSHSHPRQDLSSRQQPRHEPHKHLGAQPHHLDTRPRTTSSPAALPVQLSPARLPPAPRPPRHDLPTRDPQLPITSSVRDTTRAPSPLWLDTRTTSGRRGIMISFRGGPRGATRATRDHLLTQQDLTPPTPRTFLLHTTAEAGRVRTTRPPTHASGKTGATSTPAPRDSPTPRPQHLRHHLARVLDLATTPAGRHALRQPLQAQRGATT
jgi:hypothetical protein